MPKVEQYVLAGALAVAVAAQAPAATETVLHSFKNPPRGSGPDARVVRDSAGNFYGTTPAGGRADWGTVYKLDPAGRQTLLHAFTGGADGGVPYSGVIGDAAGNLYGTTTYGGILTGPCAGPPAGCGVVFKIDSRGNYSVIYSFTGHADGGIPYAGVIRDAEGNLYGTTFYAGSAGGGVVFMVDPAGHETVLHNFTGKPDGAFPGSGVIRDSEGNLYGATFGGGQRNVGTVYKLDAAGHETVLYSFHSTADGFGPFLAELFRDPAGNLYGTTYLGGTGNCGASSGCGVVYKVDAAGHETVLHAFTGGADGGEPYGGVVLDPAGNLYGTAESGGIATGACADKFPIGCGVVFKLDPTGQETVLYSFTGGSDGSIPYAAIRDLAGNLYGTASGGGTANLGVVYKLDASGRQTVLYDFPGPADGNNPLAGVTRDLSGNLYGTTGDGGVNDAGVVYKLDPAGHETILYSFTGGADGRQPHAGVILDEAGNLYGTTGGGGPENAGVVYKLSPAGQETVLYTFTGGGDGGAPSGVIRDSAGNLYGTTANGGKFSAGVIFRVDPAGRQTVLHSFTGGAEGGTPFAGVIGDTEGNLYGTTVGGGKGGWGVVYKLDSTAHLTVLYSFTGRADGGTPWGGVTRDSAGNLYGTTNMGGPSGRGVVFKVDPSGQETVLYSFTGGDDGGSPQAGVVLDPSGNIYGITYNGGPVSAGVVFELDTAGQETVLYRFTDGADGGFPIGGIIRDAAGNIYGTASHGGQRSVGTVFKVWAGS
jgi:uncharacterized repeat protein (TIGR03803 family)